MKVYEKYKMGVYKWEWEFLAATLTTQEVHVFVCYAAKCYLAFI